MRMFFLVAVVCVFAVSSHAGAGVTNLSDECVLKSVNDGWTWMMNTWHPKTGLIYGCPVERIEPAKNFKDGLLVWKDGKVNFGRGLGDCAIASGVALSMLCDKYAVTKDAAVREDARKVAFGLLNLARSHGYKGFVARGLCAEDGKSISRISSRDQVTHWVHGLVRYCSRDWADAQTKADFRRLIAEVAERMRRNVTPENQYNFLMADGQIDPRGICVMWGDRLYPHEAARLPMIYLTAWRMTGDEKWKALYETYVDAALDMTLKLKTKEMGKVRDGLPTYSLLQLSTSLEVLSMFEKSPARLERIREAMAYTTKIAHGRVLHMYRNPTKINYFYGMCREGEVLLPVFMDPASAWSPEAEAFLVRCLTERRMERRGGFFIVHLTAAYWRARASAAVRDNMVLFENIVRNGEKTPCLFPLPIRDWWRRLSPISPFPSCQHPVHPYRPRPRGWPLQAESPTRPHVRFHFGPPAGRSVTKSNGNLHHRQSRISCLIMQRNGQAPLEGDSPPRETASTQGRGDTKWAIN